MAVTDTWIGTASADWGAAAGNWSAGFPNSTDNVVINTPTILTIGYSGADSCVVNALAVGNDFFVMTGGSLTILTTASFADGFTQTGGVLNAGGAVTIAGAGTLTGGASEGKTAFSITGTIALANYTLGGATTLTNAATTNETGQITLGDNTGINATITNKAGAVFDIAGDYGIGQGAATARFVNAGTLEKTGGSGISFVDVNLSDTGAVTVAGSGTLEFRGPDDSFAGAISGAGNLTLGGGGHTTIASGATVATGGFVVSDNGTVVTLGENLGYAGNLTVTGFATLDLAGFTLTDSGADNFAGATIDGSGTLATAAGSDVGISNFMLGGTVNWQNSGTVGEAAQFQLGDGSAHAATFTNEKGGVYDFTNDNGILLGAAAASSFVNLAGATLEKTAGSATSQIRPDVTDNGAVEIATGTIEFDGANNSFAGAISGTGNFALGGNGDDTIASGATIASGGFSIAAGALVTLGENLAYAHNFSIGFATLDIAGPALTLTLSGSDVFSVNAAIDGNGTLVTKAGSNASVNGFTLGGSVEWQNSGAVGEVNIFAIGDGSFNTAVFVNEKGGVYNFTNDTGITIGAALDSSFDNLAGATLEKTGGAGTNQIFVDVADTGTIKINTGTIEFLGVDNSFAGLVSGPGQLMLEAGGDGSNDLIAAGTTITTPLFTIAGGLTLVTLGENLSYAGTFNLQSAATLDLGGFTLALARTDTFGVNTAIVGAGSFATAHGGTATIASSFDLGGTANWQNSGNIVELGALTIGDASFDASTFINKTGGVFNFVNDNGIGIGAMPNSSFVNLAGATLEKTGGTGNSQIHADTATSGLITVASGTIELLGAVNSVAGTISGAGQFALGGGGSSTIASGAAITSTTFGIYDGGTSVKLGENFADARNFNLESGAALDLGGFALTLSGTDTLSGSASVEGSGKLITAAGASVDVIGFTLGGTVNWQNSGTVAGQGGLTIGDASLRAASFTNEKGGIYNLVSDADIGIGTNPSSSFANLPGATLEKTAGTGDSSIATPLTNNGSVIAASGTLEFQKSIGGAGIFTIDPGAALQFDAGVASTLSVDFANLLGGDLVLDASPLFAAGIHGFGGSSTDEIDLRDINFTDAKLSYSGSTTLGVLTVTDGFETAHLKMFGNYKTANFHASTDLFGGTQIFDPPTHHTILAVGR